MKDGRYVYYTMQHRRVAETPWLKPNEPLVPLEPPWRWAFSSWDHFVGLSDWADGKPKSKEAHDETFRVRSHTGSFGWTSVKFAVAALRRLRRKYTEKVHLEEHKAQGSKYEFRLVRMTCTQKTEIVSDPAMEDGSLNPDKE